jgi:2-amino-4-hydroxy-6-hydroxymethyldihydropteridine diphosphokinase/dihydropteroate synthase
LKALKAYIGLGANVSDPMATFEAAAQKLAKLGRSFRVSPVFRTPALLPEGGPAEWKRPFLNAVAELEWGGGARDLLEALKRIETELGRLPAARWAPRVLDLDLLALGSLSFSDGTLNLPHPEAHKRSFVLDPWRELAGDFKIPGQAHSTLALSRRLPSRAPLWMGILNLTPDSFSDGGQLAEPGALEGRLARWERSGVQALDLGAESTRPGAAFVPECEEWARLAPALAFLRERYRGKYFRPLVSVDTRKPAVAEKALEAGADILNYVGGASGEEERRMLALARHSPRGLIAMHSLSVPADPKVTLDPACDPVRELRAWADWKLELFQKAGLSSDRVILDPGIGFGKTAAQSLELVRRFAELVDGSPARWLAGHSRKSFLQALGPRSAEEREGFSLGASLHLAAQGASWIRVHDPALHADAFHAHQELSS